ncbi:SRPBCC family protein [Nonomuraea sp. NPDC049625]|uniref:SRPBCC family protein n=1 Tax=Nonomuraea sp. NPDC049625 TaxID=3155775 RepID=UPI003439A747
MILDNEITVPAPPDEVFALISDVERVVTCLPGAALDGRDGDAYQGGVTVKVGPVTAAYTGTVRFLEVDAGRRLLRLQGRGADTHGGGDAEAEVILTVAEAPAGSLLRVRTDLLIRGKIVQFGREPSRPCPAGSCSSSPRTSPPSSAPRPPRPRRFPPGPRRGSWTVWRCCCRRA